MDAKSWKNVIHEQRRLIDAGLEALPKPEGPFQAAPRKCELIVGEWANWHSSAFNARPALYQQCTMRDAVTTALTLDIFHRNYRGCAHGMCGTVCQCPEFPVPDGW